MRVLKQPTALFESPSLEPTIKSDMKAHDSFEAAWDVERVREDFPILHQKVRGKKQLVYMDNAATAQKPLAVLQAMDDYYRQDNANVHRGIHALSEQATRQFERARGKVRQFLNAGEEAEIIWTRGSTEAINLVAYSLGQSFQPGDEIVLSYMEHHSNIVPWKLLAELTGAVIKVIPVDDHGQLVLEEYEKLLSPRTRLVSVVHVSNTLGTINPVAELTRLAHHVGALVLLDGAQAVPHLRVDVRALDCDFYTFSGHKFFGPTGIGVLYGKRALLEQMPPFHGGGDMIRSVSFEKTTYNELPYKFEAGTPNIAGAIGLGSAIDYLQELGHERIAAYEAELRDYAWARLRELPQIRLIGTAPERVPVFSFVMGEVHPHDIGTILDAEGIAIRTGHHCTEPLMNRFQIPATARASLAFYNTTAEIDTLVRFLRDIQEIFA